MADKPYNTSNFKLSNLAPYREDPYSYAMGLSHYMGYRVIPDDWKLPYSPNSDITEVRPIMHTEKLEKNGDNIPLAGIGSLLAYFLAKEYNSKYKDSKLAPFASATDHGTPIQGLTWKW